MNHTVRLINANAVDGMQQLIDSNMWVDCIITNFDMAYFYEENVKATLKDVAHHMKAILTSDGSIYIGVKPSDIPLVSYIFEKCGFTLKNIITIPLFGTQIPCRPSKYVDENLKS